MKAVDPTIKIGAVLSTPPDDYSWDVDNTGQHWNNQVLSQPGISSAVDFAMVHWYPYTGSNTGADGTTLLAYPGSKIPLMINGTTAGQDSGTSAGIRDSLAQWGLPNAQIMVTEFNYNGALTSGVANSANAEFVADSYASWLDAGVTSIQYLEMNKSTFIGDSSSLTRGSAFWAVKMLNIAEDPGDSAVNATSDTSTLRAHSYKRADGSVAVMILNEGTTAQNVGVTINGSLLASSGTLYSSAGTGITTSSVSGLGNSFTVNGMPGRTIYTYIIPARIPGDYNGDGVVNAADYAVWRSTTGQVGTNLAADSTGPGGTPDGIVDDLDYQFWAAHFGQIQGSGAGSLAAVPEPNALALIALGGSLLFGARNRLSGNGIR